MVLCFIADTLVAVCLNLLLVGVACVCALMLLFTFVLDCVVCVVCFWVRFYLVMLFGFVL